MRQELTLDLAPEPKAPGAARVAISRALADRLPKLQLNALLTVVNALVTNSVKHGPGSPIRIHVQLRDDGTLAGEVRDQGAGPVAIRHVDPVKGGTGLKLVDALTDLWGVQEGTSNVWFELST